MDVSPLITKNRNPLNSAHNWANIIEWKSFKNHFSGGSRCNTMDGYGRRATDPRLNVVIRTLRRQHRCFTTESVLWPNNPIIGGWAVLFTPWKYIFYLLFMYKFYLWKSEIFWPLTLLTRWKWSIYQSTNQWPCQSQPQSSSLVHCPMSPSLSLGKVFCVSTRNCSSWE